MPEALNHFLYEPRGSSDAKVQALQREEVKREVHSFFKNGEEADKVLRVLLDDGPLFSLCADPIASRIMCTALKPELEKGSDLDQYITTTAIYLLYLKGLITGRGGNKTALICLKKLCTMANKGVLGEKVRFQEYDLGRYGLSYSQVEAAFPNNSIFYESSTFYGFIHPSVQEFLAALHYGLDDGYGEEDGASWGKEDSSLPDICKGQSIGRGVPTLAVRFLFGLLNKKQVKAFSESTGCNVSLPDPSKMAKWLMDFFPPGFCAKAIFCLHETQNRDFIKGAMSSVSSIDLTAEPLMIFCPPTPMWGDRYYFKQLAYCLETCERVPSMTFSLFVMDPEDLDLLMPYLQRCQALEFSTCELPSRSYDDLFRGPTKVQFSFCRIGSEAVVKDLCEGLRHPGCTVQELRFHIGRRTLECWNSPAATAMCRDIRSVLIANRSLTTLDLSGKDLQSSGVKILNEGLRESACTLKDLRLRDCSLTPLCCEDLSLITKPLAKLDLSYNNLQDSGVKLLCEGLRHPDCTLQELSLRRCQLSPLCCAYLASALITNRFLIKLDLEHNKIKSSGAKRLCKGLQDCSLQELSLEWCGLSQRCCKAISSVLITNRSLTKLNLNRNRLKDSGVKILCEGLKHPDCTLQELSLHWCRLTPMCCDDLRSIFITNRYLAKLDLSWNNLEDSGMKLLYDGLRDPSCILQGLRLYFCDLSRSFCNGVWHVMRKSKQHAALRATCYRLRVSGVKTLCEGLRHPACTLQELNLERCGLNPQCCEDLRSVLLTNKSLTRLDLAYDDISDSGLKVLCEALRDPGCPLKELSAVCCRITSSCLKDLHSVLTTNPNLRRLNTEVRNDRQTPDSEIKSWCEALEDRGCYARQNCRRISVIYPTPS